MYTHAYQSYVWNKMATERLKQNKLKAIAGDLIVIDACTELGALTFEVHMRDKNQIKVHKVTNEEETLQIFDISMVSLPLPGYAVFIPENIAGKKYEELLSEDHVEPSLFIKKNLSGGYRKLVVPVENLSWDFLKYSDRNEVLTLSDFEEFQGKTLPSGDTEGPYKAIRINFSLPSSCYASMALREIMKMDTTTAFNRDLSERLKNGKTLNSEKKLNGDQYEIEF
ncbi:pseudouridylate synthase 7 homolog [Zophobas morio]|uniref:pseudouridylate synthase 7 homolog n=1 Tax=Zophobas morio TaxID=2755281 RepID=UPI003083C234